MEFAFERRLKGQEVFADAEWGSADLRRDPFS